jgi:hypothetical protein
VSTGTIEEVNVVTVTDTDTDTETDFDAKTVQARSAGSHCRVPVRSVRHHHTHSAVTPLERFDLALPLFRREVRVGLVADVYGPSALR